MHGLPATLRFKQEPGWFRQLACDAALICNEDPHEDRLVETPAHLVAGTRVESVRIAKKLQPSLEVLDPCRKVLDDRGELCVDVRAIYFDLPKPLLGQFNGQASVGDEGTAEGSGDSSS